MAMYDDVVIRLLQLGYTVPAGGTPDAAVTYAIDRAAEKIKANINRTDIPDGLHYTWVDMAAGLFLFDKKVNTYNDKRSVHPKVSPHELRNIGDHVGTE